MKLAKHDLVQLLHTQGYNAIADRAAEALPDQIDTERDRELLASVGLDHDRLAGHLAAASIHVIG
jgi:hypothetical protein